ncbi:outer membrane beta-barrel protein [Kaarinaea lacus]
MKKILVASSLAFSALTVTPAAMAIDITPSGFVDFIWTLSDGTDVGKNGAEGRFDTSGELDVESKLKEGIMMRFDADVNPGSSGNDSARLEQIFLKWDIDQKMALLGGVYNNNLTFEREDAPDMYQITHGQLWDIWESTTSEDGNNLQGLEFNYQFKGVNLIVGYLNDLGDVADKNSVKIAAEVTAVKNLDIVLGLITQESPTAVGGNPASVGDIFDIFAKYKWNNWLFGGEILIADEQVDSGFMLMANYQFNNKFSLTGRYDFVKYDVTGVDDTSSITVAGLYSISENLFANAEIRFNDDPNQSPVPFTPAVGEGDGTTARLELLATF